MNKLNRASIANYLNTEVSALLRDGLTVREIAERSGISEAMLYQLRTNKKPVSWEHAFSLHEAYPAFDRKILAPSFFERLKQFGSKIVDIERSSKAINS